MAVTPGTYPAPRTNRNVPPLVVGQAPSAGLAPAPPTSRTLVFDMNSAANSRTTRSSARIRGPALIRAITLVKGGTATNLRQLELGVSDTSVSEENVALTTTRPWRPLFERVSDGSTPLSGSAFAMTHIDLQASEQGSHVELGIPVIDSEFFLTITLWNNAGGVADSVEGVISILEAVSAEALANFL